MRGTVRELGIGLGFGFATINQNFQSLDLDGDARFLFERVEIFNILDRV